MSASDGLPHQLLPLLLRGFLHLVGLALFFGDLAVRLRLHQLRRRIDVADQRVDGLHVVGGQGASRICSAASVCRWLRALRKSSTV